MALNSLQAVLEQLGELPQVIPAGLPPGSLTTSQIDEVLSLLPHLTERQVEDLGHKDSMCPICYTSFSALLAEEEMAQAMDSPAHPIEELGVTRLDKAWQCSHMFCRKDLRKWIKDGNNSCPVCRRNLLQEDLNTNSTRQEPGDAVLLEQLFLQSFSTIPGGPAFQGSGLPSEFIGPIRRGSQLAQRDDDSNGYSAMYS